MKKKNRFLPKLAKSFDKHIVLPITRIVFKVTKVFDKSSHRFEAILAKQTTLLFLSLLLSVALFILVDQKLIVFNNSSAEVFKDQKVEVQYNEERFVLEGVPEKVDITLIGSKADLYIAKQSASKHSVKIDLSDIKEPGTYKVDLTYDIDSKTIESSVNPSQATIIAYLKESENRTLSYNVINSDHLDNTIDIDNVSLNIDQVVISGASYKLETVATVEALIDVDKLESTEPGKHTLEDIVLKAYDSNGNIVDVEINHSAKITAEVTISSSSREVPLNLVVKNDMPFGKAISSYSFSKDTVIAYGSSETLDALATNGINIELDASNLDSNYSGTIEIPKPSGVKKLDTNRVDLNVNVTNAVSSPNYYLTLKIDTPFTPSGYTAGAASSQDSEVLVKPTCAENICKSLTAADVQAYVDLSEYSKLGPGTYEVPVLIKAKTTNARLSTFVVTPEKVKIKLTKN